MNFRQFLKPDWRKIVVFIILLIIFLPFKYSLIRGELPVPVKGLPLPIWIEDVYSSLLKIFLIIDLIFWYPISCFIIWIYDKLKKE
jgi:hypothetical protein